MTNSEIFYLGMFIGASILCLIFAFKYGYYRSEYHFMKDMFSVTHELNKIYTYRFKNLIKAIEIYEEEREKNGLLQEIELIVDELNEKDNV